MLNAISVSECGLPASRGAVPLHANQPFTPYRLYRNLYSRCPMPSCAIGRDSRSEEKNPGWSRRMPPWPLRFSHVEAEVQCNVKSIEGTSLTFSPSHSRA